MATKVSGATQQVHAEAATAVVTEECMSVSDSFIAPNLLLQVQNDDLCEGQIMDCSFLFDEHDIDCFVCVCVWRGRQQPAVSDELLLELNILT